MSSATHAQQLRTNGITPFCLILDGAYRVVKAGPDRANNPLASLYTWNVRSDRLPPAFEVVVRALRASLRSASSATMQNMHVTVAPVRHDGDERLAVFVYRLPSRVAA